MSTSIEWDVMPDGRLLAIQKGEGEDDIADFNVVLDWSDGLRARMSSGLQLDPTFARNGRSGPGDRERCKCLVLLWCRRLGSNQHSLAGRGF